MVCVPGCGARRSLALRRRGPASLEKWLDPRAVLEAMYLSDLVAYDGMFTHSETLLRCGSANPLPTSLA